MKLLLCVCLAVVGTVHGLFSSRRICYDDYGCFEPRPGSIILPDSPEKVNTHFFLYTRNNPTEPQLISANNLFFLDITKPIKVIIHGFIDEAKNKWVSAMAKELLLSEDLYVIAVDWSGGNRFPYSQAVANTVIAAASTRRLLQAMIVKGVTPEQIHLIGHSLGAHISSFIGREIRNLGRISGLDPAGPQFYDSDHYDRLDASDALFVDVLHTDGAPHVVSGFGYTNPLGHVDFYPNGGSSQPTCASTTHGMIAQSLWDLVSTFSIENASDEVACNHLSALFYYTDSINTPSPAFGYPCSNYSSFVDGLCTSCGPNGDECQRVGYHASTDRTLGSLYFMTIDGVKPPHFGFHYKVSVQSALHNEEKTRGNFAISFDNQKERIPLFDDDKIIRHGSTYSKTVLLTSNPKSLQTITISFKKTGDFFAGIGMANEWNFRVVTVYDMQTNDKYTFCPESSSISTIKSGSSLTYIPCV